MTAKPRADSVGNLIPQLLGKLEATYPDEAHRIWELWADAVGDDLAARTSPLEFKKGRLTVAVSSAPWRQQVSLLAPRIIAAVNERLGVELVKSLKTRQADVAPPVKPEPLDEAPWRDIDLDEREAEEVSHSADEIKDPVLADSIRRARAMALKRELHRRTREDD